MQHAKVTHRFPHRRIQRNRYELLPREEAAPHSYTNNNMSSEQVLRFLEQKFTQFEQKYQDSNALLTLASLFIQTCMPH